MSIFKDLDVWQMAHQLTLDVYQATEDSPKIEQYRLEINFVDRRHRYLQILLKERAGILKRNF